MRLSPLNQRRWRNFRANRRAYWSLMLFGLLFVLSLFANLIANDHPLLVSYKGEWRSPVFQFYSEKDFGGDFKTEAVYSDPVVQCLIVSGGNDGCFDTPEKTEAAARSGKIDGKAVTPGWILWPLIPYSYNTVNDIQGAAPSAPDAKHWLGTDDTARDVLA
ncbi:ABC transporter permease, partial [Thioclava sp. BHET1]